MNAPPPSARPVRRPSTLKLLFWLLLVPAVLIVLYFTFVLNWNYSAGERAGWVQKFSKKGWLCKTWEGEMAMVTMPGTVAEKFYFTVREDPVSARINKTVGTRVVLHYEEHRWIPFSCFGDPVTSSRTCAPVWTRVSSSRNADSAPKPAIARKHDRLRTGPDAELVEDI